MKCTVVSIHFVIWMMGRDARQRIEGTMNRFKKIFAVLMTLMVLAVGGLYLYKDAAVRAAVIAGGDVALGAGSTDLVGARVDVFKGNLAMIGLRLKNPEGYQQPHFFQMKRFDAALSMPSLLEDRVVIPSVKLDGLELLAESIIDKDGPRLNLLTIRNNLPARGEGEKSSAEKSGKKFVIEKLKVEGMKVTGVLTIPGGGSWPIDLDVPPFEIEEIGKKHKGVLLAEVMVIVLDAILVKAIEAIEVDGSDKLKVLGDAKDLLKVFGGGLKESGLDPEQGKKLLDKALKKGIDDLFKRKKKDR